jgi:hypothetical protein
MQNLVVWGRVKTKPIKANSKPILTQNKANQSQNLSEIKTNL